jgi:hypothetical protein
MKSILYFSLFYFFAGDLFLFYFDGLVFYVLSIDDCVFLGIGFLLDFVFFVLFILDFNVILIIF